MTVRSLIGLLLAMLFTSLAQAASLDPELQVTIERQLEKGGSCTIGHVSVTEAVRVGDALALTGKTTNLGYSLELPWRWNQNDISAIPVGAYEGRVLLDGELGWRVAIDDVEGRKDVRIHVGNYPSQTTGCILIGQSWDGKSCKVSGSGAALAELANVYHATDHLSTDTRTEKRIRIVVKEARGIRSEP